MSIKTLEEHRSFGGVQGFYEHPSDTVGLPMRFGVYRPPQALAGARVPVLVYLAGLTCNEQTFAMKAGAQEHAARLGLMLVTPDTSPRDTGIEGADKDWDFGVGAGFYLDATQAPWSRHWRMESWITGELLALVFAHFPGREDAVGVFGHSMGGHGALMLALKHPRLFRSVSAFAPICAPIDVPWGQKAFTNYLGSDRAAWAGHDACALIAHGSRTPHILVDQGEADPFLDSQLLPGRLEDTCRAAGQPLTLRRHAGYDHGYYFVSTVIREHLEHHAGALA